ncbi:MAG: hypothetical protein ABH872_00090 [Candidatus Omnitrophota bacterium]
MSDKPWIISLLSGLVVILIIGGVSGWVKVNALSEDNKKEVKKTMSLEQTIESLKAENAALINEKKTLVMENERLNKSVAEFKDSVSLMNAQIEGLTKEVQELTKFKESLQNDLNAVPVENGASR